MKNDFTLPVLVEMDCSGKLMPAVLKLPRRRPAFQDTSSALHQRGVSPHRGMFPNLRGRLYCCLPSVKSNPWMIFQRVSEGNITSSIFIYDA